jgi:hypothetical protein
MNHAVAVALKCVAVRVLGFGVSPPPASFDRKSQARQHEKGGGLLRRQFGQKGERDLTYAAGPGTQRLD